MKGGGGEERGGEREGGGGGGGGGRGERGGGGGGETGILTGLGELLQGDECKQHDCGMGLGTLWRNEEEREEQEEGRCYKADRGSYTFKEPVYLTGLSYHIVVLELSVCVCVCVVSPSSPVDTPGFQG